MFRNPGRLTTHSNLKNKHIWKLRSYCGGAHPIQGRREGGGAGRGGGNCPGPPTLIGLQLESESLNSRGFFKLVRAFLKLRAPYSSSTCSLDKVQLGDWLVSSLKIMMSWNLVSTPLNKINFPTTRTGDALMYCDWCSQIGIVSLQSLVSIWS